eukprot:Pgem_evm1s14902
MKFQTIIAIAVLAFYNTNAAPVEGVGSQLEGMSRTIGGSLKQVATSVDPYVKSEEGHKAIKGIGIGIDGAVGAVSGIGSFASIQEGDSQQEKMAKVNSGLKGVLGSLNSFLSLGSL